MLGSVQSSAKEPDSSSLTRSLRALHAHPLPEATPARGFGRIRSRVAQWRDYSDLSGAGAIARRAFANNSFDGVLTMMGDEFGGDIPVGPFAIIGDDSIGRGIVETLSGSRSRAVLMQNHGPFTIGKNAKDAVKAAVMVEEVARTVHIAKQLGDVIPIAQENIDSLFERYQNVYGQH